MPAGEDRSYSGNAVPTPLTATISNTATSIPITSSTGWPDGTGGPFFIRIDSEVIKCSSRTSLTLNVQTSPVTGRGWDGTTAASHTIGAVVEHVFTATDAEDANEHISDTALDHHTQYLTVARHDVSARHGFGILPTAGTPSTSLVGDTATSGSSQNVARVDHKHAREGFGSPASAGPVNADGTAITVARSDHKHAGGIPILTSGTRPASPVVGERITESDTFRDVMWTGSRWQRVAYGGAPGATVVAVGRDIARAVPSGGASSYILPWNAELLDSDGFFPAPDGTTTHTITVPSQAVSGWYSLSAMLIWSTLTTARSYMEIIHNDTVSLFQYRTITTDDDRGAVSTTVSLSAGHTIQLGMWQNTGASIDVIYAHLYVYRLGA